MVNDKFKTYGNLRRTSALSIPLGSLEFCHLSLFGIWCLGFVACALILIIGCSRTARQADVRSAPDGQTARTEVDRGPIRVMVEVTPHPAALSDEPTLTLTVEHEEGVDIELPPFGEAVGEFAVLDFQTPLPESRGGRQVQRQIYRLEPPRSGQLTIDPISVTFTDTRPQGDGNRITVETEALPITITSIIDDEAPTLDDLKPATGPVSLGASRAWVWWSLGSVVALAGASGVGLWWLRRCRLVVEEQTISPEQLASDSLRRLMAENLAERDVKQFYVRLTGIVRRYIESTKGIHAPEQTTEEFLREIGRGQTFSLDERGRLKDFLESADLVKYAAHQPRGDDVSESLARARAFMGIQWEQAA